MMTPNKRKNDTLASICAVIENQERFLLTSHARPDGDAIGSQLAMVFALKQLNKQVRIINCDPTPDLYRTFPGVQDIEISATAKGNFDALVVMECSNLGRPGVEDLQGNYTINIDHHLGNENYGDINWIDETAAACGEMVFDLIRFLGITITHDIATHLYLATLTDTGSFHYGNITARTFEMCRQLVEAGVNPSSIARKIFDSGTRGRLKLVGAILNKMDLEASDRLAVIYLNDEIMNETGGSEDDLEGLVNIPLSAEVVQAVAFFKDLEGQPLRVSLRSKGDIDVRAIAVTYGGGGHANASGFTSDAPIEAVRKTLISKITATLDNNSPDS